MEAVDGLIPSRRETPVVAWSASSSRTASGTPSSRPGPVRLDLWSTRSAVRVQVTDDGPDLLRRPARTPATSRPVAGGCSSSKSWPTAGAWSRVSARESGSRSTSSSAGRLPRRSGRAPARASHFLNAPGREAAAAGEQLRGRPAPVERRAVSWRDRSAGAAPPRPSPTAASRPTASSCTWPSSAPGARSSSATVSRAVVLVALPVAGARSQPATARSRRICAGTARGSAPAQIEAYDLPSLCGDLIALLDEAGEEQAVFVGTTGARPSSGNCAIAPRPRRRRGRPRRALRRRLLAPPIELLRAALGEDSTSSGSSSPASPTRRWRATCAARSPPHAHGRARGRISPTTRAGLAG